MKAALEIGKKLGAKVSWQMGLHLWACCGGTPCEKNVRCSRLKHKDDCHHHSHGGTRPCVWHHRNSTCAVLQTRAAPVTVGHAPTCLAETPAAALHQQASSHPRLATQASVSAYFPSTVPTSANDGASSRRPGWQPPWGSARDTGGGDDGASVQGGHWRATETQGLDRLARGEDRSGTVPGVHVNPCMPAVSPSRYR